ncbi:MAG: thiamine pyrophosphate-binding protein [Pseudomonadota bacterium]
MRTNKDIDNKPNRKLEKQNYPIKNLERNQADMILDYLADMGVGYVFGVPGGAIEPLYNALARRKARGYGNGPYSVVARNECGAAFMADGYARVTGKLGVCCATTGPGTTNLITGVASAYADNIPLLVITPQTALPNFGKKGLQESSSDAIDTVAMMACCTQYNTMVSHLAQLEGKLYTSLSMAFRPPGGPSHLSIPMDIMAEPLVKKEYYYDVKSLYQQPEVVDESSLDQLCGKIIEAKNVVIFLGSGAYKAIDTILYFVELIRAKLVTTPAAKGLVVNNHPFFCGVFGFAGHDKAQQTLNDPDTQLILAIGTALSELETGGWDQNALLNNKLIHIEDNLEHFSRSPMASMHVHGNLNTIFNALNQRALEAIRSGKRCPILNPKSLLLNLQPSGDITELLTKDEIETYNNDTLPLKPQRIMYFLNELFPEDTRYVIDAGNAWSWATHYLNIKQICHYYIGMGYGSMGWAVGTSVGMAIALKDTPVCCITGDGSYLMSGQEITVALQHKVPLIVIILNDSYLGMVKHGQQLGGGERIAIDLPTIDYAAMAKAMGIQSFNIKTADDFRALDMDAICEYPGPTLLDVIIDAEEVPPMGARMKILEQSAAEKVSD